MYYCDCMLCYGSLLQNSIFLGGSATYEKAGELHSNRAKPKTRFTLPLFSPHRNVLITTHKSYHAPLEYPQRWMMRDEGLLGRTAVKWPWHS